MSFTGFLLWLILLILCWPIAILLIILYPILWLLALPFRLLGITVEAVYKLIRELLMLPFRVVRSLTR